MSETKQRVCVIAVPPDLPNDDLSTQDMFPKCVGHSFDVIGMNGHRVELAVGEMTGQSPYMHSIWIEMEYTDAAS